MNLNQHAVKKTEIIQLQLRAKYYCIKSNTNIIMQILSSIYALCRLNSTQFFGRKLLQKLLKIFELCKIESQNFALVIEH